MKLIKWIVITLIILILLVVIGVTILVFTVNPNHYKSTIEKTVYNQTGHTLVLKGDLSWSFFPDLGIEVGPGSLSNQEGFRSDIKGAFVSWKRAALKVDMWALISGNLEIETLDVNHAHVQLVRNKQGAVNWAFAKEMNVESKDVESKNAESKNTELKKVEGHQNVSKTSDTSKHSGASHLTLKHVMITDGNIEYYDQETDEHYFVKGVNVSIMRAGDAVRVKSSARFSLPQQLSGNVTVDATIALQSNLVKLSKGQILLDLKRQNKPNLNFIAHLEGEHQVEQDQTHVPFFKLQLNGRSLGELKDIEFNNHKGTFSGQYYGQSLNLTQLSHDVGAPVKQRELQKLLKKVSLAMDVRGDRQYMMISGIKLDAEKMQLNGQVEVPSFKPFTVEPKMHINQLVVSNFIDLKGMTFALNDINFKGHLTSKDHGLYGQLGLTSKNGLLKGIDLDKLSENFQNFLVSLAKADNIGRNFQKIRHELLFLNVLNPKEKVNPNNGRETRFYDLDVQNTFTGTRVKLDKMSWRGDQFYLEGLGETDWKSQRLDYLFKIYPYNPANKSLAAYQKIYIPYVVTGSYDKTNSLVDQKSLERQMQPLLQQAIQSVIQQKAGELLNNFLNK